MLLALPTPLSDHFASVRGGDGHPLHHYLGPLLLVDDVLIGGRQGGSQAPAVTWGEGPALG